MYKRDQIDFMTFFQKKQWSDIKKAPEFNLDSDSKEQQFSKQSKLETWYLGFDHSRPPFDQLPARKAVAEAIDKQLLLKKALGIIGKNSNTFTDITSLGHVVPSEAWSYVPKLNPERAKKLLAQAYPDGENFPKIYISGSSEHNAVVQLIKNMLERNLGIMIEEKADEVLGGLDAAPNLFVHSKQAVYSHAHYFLSEFYATKNKLRWGDKNHNEYMELIEEALAHQSNSAQQKDLYSQAEQILCEQTVLVPLFSRDVAFLAKPWLQWIPSKTGVQQIHTWAFRD